MATASSTSWGNDGQRNLVYLNQGDQTSSIPDAGSDANATQAAGAGHAGLRPGRLGARRHGLWCGDPESSNHIARESPYGIAALRYGTAPTETTGSRTIHRLTVARSLLRSISETPTGGMISAVFLMKPSAGKSNSACSV